MTKPDNPLAFPLPSLTLENGLGYASNPGMRLRDYFAGQALLILPHFIPSEHKLDASEMANSAYWIADAMLAERAKP